MWLILEKVYIKLLNVFFFLKKCSSFFTNEFSIIYTYSLKNLNNFELMDKQEAIILLLIVYLTLSLSRELELLEKKLFHFVTYQKQIAPCKRGAKKVYFEW